MACTDNLCQLTLDDDSIDTLFDCPVGGVGQGRHAMGLGAIGDGKVIFKRKFRWTFEIEFCCNNVVDGVLQPPKVVAKEFVKIGARPQIDIEEIEINYLNGKMWIPGKGTWQTMTVTYYDVAGATNNGLNTNSVLAWIATIYDFTDCRCLPMNSVPEQYEGVARLVLWDGCGNPLEAWLLRHVWPQSVNWGDLDMSSSEECTVELTLRYSDVSYRSFCPNQPIDKCPCGPCPV